ncbi:hypothetical protein Plec18167_003671 [Paecilomyces lecythidis]|uniref:Uncharacterized protein n=1 Tax=Paecilomyces lecythidis TaxID=3004212 RepID=A0ABR3XW79_9EURO
MSVSSSIPFLPLGKPYIPVETRATKFVFDRHNLAVPPHLQPITPKKVHEELRKVREIATVTFNYLKKLDQLYHARFYHMCPKTDLAQYYLHRESIDRLLSWEKDVVHPYLQAAAQKHRYRILPLMAPTAKIPPFILHFHIEEEEYTAFQEEYSRLRMTYLRGPYLRWIDAKSNMEKVLQTCETEMGDMDYRAWRRWWDCIFLREMDKWENRAQEIKMPSWNEIVKELYGLIQEKVDLDGFWDE